MEPVLTALSALPPASGPRRVLQLAFPEVLVIWALRRYNGCRLSREARAAVIAPEFSRAFGLAALEPTLAAFTRLADSLAASARLPQAFSLLDDDRINAAEEALLATLAALQQGGAAQAAALSEWSLLPSGRATYFAAAASLARALREAGLVVPYRAPHCGPAPRAQGSGKTQSAPGFAAATARGATVHSLPAHTGVGTGAVRGTP